MMNLIILGCDVGDSTFETDPEITGYSIMWNITRIAADAAKGQFGKPIKRMFADMPEMTPHQQTNIDWEKVNRFRSMPDVLAIPCLALDYYVNGRTERHNVDGNARITARRLNGLPDFETFIVPSSQEQKYRLRLIADGIEVTPQELGAFSNFD